MYWLNLEIQNEIPQGTNSSFPDFYYERINEDLETNTPLKIKPSLSSPKSSFMLKPNPDLKPKFIQTSKYNQK